MAKKKEEKPDWRAKEATYVTSNPGSEERRSMAVLVAEAIQRPGVTIPFVMDAALIPIVTPTGETKPISIDPEFYGVVLPKRPFHGHGHVPSLGEHLGTIESLALSIREFGLDQKILVFVRADGVVILDGFDRFFALLGLLQEGLKLSVRGKSLLLQDNLNWYDGPTEHFDLLAAIIRHNLARKHLGPEDRDKALIRVLVAEGRSGVFRSTSRLADELGGASHAHIGKLRRTLFEQGVLEEPQFYLDKNGLYQPNQSLRNRTRPAPTRLDLGAYAEPKALPVPAAPPAEPVAATEPVQWQAELDTWQDALLGIPKEAHGIEPAWVALVQAGLEAKSLSLEGKTTLAEIAEFVTQARAKAAAQLLEAEVRAHEEALEVEELKPVPPLHTLLSEVCVEARIPDMAATPEGLYEWAVARDAVDGLRLALAQWARRVAGHRPRSASRAKAARGRGEMPGSPAPGQVPPGRRASR